MSAGHSPPVRNVGIVRSMEYANLSRRSLLALGTAGALACTAASAPAFAGPVPHRRRPVGPARRRQRPLRRRPARPPAPGSRLPAGPRRRPAALRVRARLRRLAGARPSCCSTRASATCSPCAPSARCSTTRSSAASSTPSSTSACRTVVVLGHAGCGAVRAAIDLVHGTSAVTGSVSTVARAIEATVRATHPDSRTSSPPASATRRRRIAEELPRRSGMIDTERVEIIPAVYDLASRARPPALTPILTRRDRTGGTTPRNRG